MAAPAKAAGLGELDDKVEKVEFKVTVLKTDESKVRGMLAAAEPVPRTVYFYDTPDLDLDRRNVVLRARVTGMKEQSTVKLRPVPLPVPAPWSETGKVEIEVDVVGAEPTTSAKLDRTLDPGDIEPTRKPSKLFNEAQETLIASVLPSLDDLRLLGPIDAKKWELEPDGFRHKLEIEEWTVDDSLHFIELSIKVDRRDADEAGREWHALLDGRDISHTHVQVSKTRAVLEHFAAVS
jgi:CYTH domain